MARLADAWGVATRYENADQQEVAVDREVVVKILAQFGVDASTEDSVARELAEVERRRAEQKLPSTIVIREYETYDLRGPATIELEDGTSFAVERHVPDSVPLGWHRVVTGDQTVTLAVAPRTLPDVPHTWGWMLQLYAARSKDSWGMGDFADLATIARRSSLELDSRRRAGQSGAGAVADASRRTLAVLADQPPVREPAVPARHRHGRVPAGLPAHPAAHPRPQARQPRADRLRRDLGRQETGTGAALPRRRRRDGRRAGEVRHVLRARRGPRQGLAHVARRPS